MGGNQVSLSWLAPVSVALSTDRLHPGDLTVCDRAGSVVGMTLGRDVAIKLRTTSGHSVVVTGTTATGQVIEDVVTVIRGRPIEPGRTEGTRRNRSASAPDGDGTSRASTAPAGAVEDARSAPNTADRAASPPRRVPDADETIHILASAPRDADETVHVLASTPRQTPDPDETIAAPLRGMRAPQVADADETVQSASRAVGARPSEDPDGAESRRATDRGPGDRPAASQPRDPRAESRPAESVTDGRQGDSRPSDSHSTDSHSTDSQSTDNRPDDNRPDGRGDVAEDDDTNDTTTSNPPEQPATAVDRPAPPAPKPAGTPSADVRPGEIAPQPADAPAGGRQESSGLRRLSRLRAAAGRALPPPSAPRARPTPLVPQPPPEPTGPEPRSTAERQVIISDARGARLLTVGEALYIGRAPVVPPQHGGSRGRAWTVASSDETVSSTHLRLRLLGRQFLAQDVWSTNGTMVVPPTGFPYRLGPGEELPLMDGTELKLGDGVVVTVPGDRHGS